MNEKPLNNIIARINCFIQIVEKDRTRYEEKGPSYKFMVDHCEGRIETLKHVLKIIDEERGKNYE